MRNINYFILDYDFDGDIDKFIIALQKGNAISYNNEPFPVQTVYPQGKQIVLSLWHKNIIIDLESAFKSLKINNIVKITMNIIK